MANDPIRRGLHPKILEAQDLMQRGRMRRREFVRIAALLGLSAGAAYAMAGLPEPAFAATGGDLPFPPDDPKAREGGVLRVAMQVQKMEDPATYSWTQMSNQSRQIVEYLSMTGPDNMTRPMLCESWEASDDLKTWTAHLRQNVVWHNGDAFTADDVIFNFKRWMDPALGSSNAGLSTFSALKPDQIEKVDDHTIKLHLSKPVLSVAEDVYNYPDRDPAPLVQGAVQQQPDRHRPVLAGRVRSRRQMHPQACHQDHQRSAVQLLGR